MAFSKLSQTVLSVAVALGFVIAVPAMASAAPSTLGGASTESANIDSSHHALFDWPAHTFAPGAAVSVSVDGSGAAPIGGTAKGHDVTWNAGFAGSDGSFATDIVFPPTASGHYSATFTDARGTSVVGTIQSTAVVPSTPAATSGLGSNIYASIVVIWAAVGLIGLLVAYFVMRATVRRHTGAAAARVTASVPPLAQPASRVA